MWTVLLLLACSEEWTDETDVPVSFGFVIFDEELEDNVYEPFEDGDTILLEAGFQGGQHFAPWVHPEGISDGEEVRMRSYLVDPATGDEIMSMTQQAYMYDDPQLGFPSPGVSTTLRVPDQSLVDQEVELRYHITYGDIDARGRISGTVEFIPFF